MKPSLFTIMTAFTLLLAAQASAQSIKGLKFNTALEVEFQTEKGKTYTLQGALNHTNWTDLAAPVLGNGRRVDQVYSLKHDDLAQCGGYRLRVDNGPAQGFAPQSLAGRRMQLRDSAMSTVVEYASATVGHEADGCVTTTFAYKYSRLSENNVEVRSSVAPDQQEVLTYLFTSAGAGTLVRDEYRRGLLQRRRHGIFKCLSPATENDSHEVNLQPLITDIIAPVHPFTELANNEPRSMK